MLGLSVVDIVILLVYLLGVTMLGIYTMRKVHGVSDFIMPRRFGKWMLTLHAFGSGTHSDQAVGVASKTYTSGLSGIWYQWLYLFGTPFYWLIAPVMRRFRALTTGDIFELRYNRSVATLYALISMSMMITTIGLMLKGSGAVISGASGGAIDPDLAILFMTLLFVAYGAAGGLSAAIVTDFVQGILTILFSFLLLPSVLAAVGGMEGMRATITDPAMFSLAAPAGIGVFYIAVISVNALVGIATQPHILANCAAGRTEQDGQFGFMVGSFTKRFCTVAWCLTGLAGVAYYVGQEVHPDHLYGLLANEFLPKLLPGALGLFIATLLASVMSSCDSFMIAASALFTRNVYEPAVPDKSEQHYLWVARGASVVVVILGVLYAYWLDGVVQGLEILWKIGPMMGICFWLGFFWRRTTPAAAWASTLSALAAWWFGSQAFFAAWIAQIPGAESLGLVSFSETTASIPLPWQMIFYLVVGTLVGIVVSLFSTPTDPAKVERYYALQRTPVLEEEPSLQEPCQLPEGANTLPRNVFFPNTNLEIAKPTQRSVVGFALGWVAVISIIVFVYWISMG